MQDRFRFRHWDKQINKMRYGDIQLGCNGTPFIISPELPKLVQDIDDVITMQCTGLKDKNGKLIYEGDIVKENISGLYKIIYRKCAFYLENEETLCPIHELAKTFSEMKLEVIGNIYENKE